MTYRETMRPAVVVILLLAGVLPAAAAEYVVLTTGFRLKVAAHEREGDRFHLTTENGGRMELPAAVVAGFEQEDYQAPPAPEDQKPAEAPSPEQLDQSIRDFAEQQGLPVELIESVIEAESAFDPQAVSPKGAAGLMQLMPETAEELKVIDRFDPHQNIGGGSAYLRSLLDLYSGHSDQLVRALAAYNAGPGRVDRYNGLPPFNETRLFVKKVIRLFLERTAAPNQE